MKSTAAYYLMLLYLTVMIRPIIPFIQDEWQHEFNEIEHISSVHAKYGSHHLEKEISQTNSDDRSKNQNSLKAEDQGSAHLVIAGYRHQIFLHTTVTKYSCYQLNTLPFICIANQGPPPKFA